MEAHELDIVIGPDGEARVEVRGTKGPACERYIAVFQEILQGAMRVERTAAYYEQAAETEETVKIR